MYLGETSASPQMMSGHSFDCLTFETVCQIFAPREAVTPPDGQCDSPKTASDLKMRCNIFNLSFVAAFEIKLDRMTVQMHYNTGSRDLRRSSQGEFPVDLPFPEVIEVTWINENYREKSAAFANASRRSIREWIDYLLLISSHDHIDRITLGKLPVSTTPYQINRALDGLEINRFVIRQECHASAMQSLPPSKQIIMCGDIFDEDQDELRLEFLSKQYQFVKLSDFDLSVFELLEIKSENVEITNCQFNNEMINRILKEWKKGWNPNLNHLELQFHARIEDNAHKEKLILWNTNFREIERTIDCFDENFGSEVSREEHHVYDFCREDGATGTVLFRYLEKTLILMELFVTPASSDAVILNRNEPSSMILENIFCRADAKNIMPIAFKYANCHVYMPEDAELYLDIVFRVQRRQINRLRYKQTVKQDDVELKSLEINVNLGNYKPSTGNQQEVVQIADEHKKKFSRGKYRVCSSLHDIDGYLKIVWYWYLIIGN